MEGLGADEGKIQADVECVDRVQDRGQLQAVVSTVMNFRVYKEKRGSRDLMLSSVRYFRELTHDVSYQTTPKCTCFHWKGVIVVHRWCCKMAPTCTYFHQ